MTTPTKNQPVETLRDGSLKISIWRNQSAKGIRYSTGEVIRSYKDQNEKWQDTRYLSNGEILKAARLLNLAYDRILQMRTADKVYDQPEGQA